MVSKKLYRNTLRTVFFDWDIVLELIDPLSQVYSILCVTSCLVPLVGITRRSFTAQGDVQTYKLLIHHTLNIFSNHCRPC